MNRRNPKKQNRKGTSSVRNNPKKNGRSSRNHSNGKNAGGYGSGMSSSARPSTRKVQLYAELTTPIAEEIPQVTQGPDPFALFCACYLGIQENNTYRPPRLQDAARMLGVPISTLKQSLKDYALDLDTVMRSEFELSLAKLDIKVAPEGINKFELAKELYKEYREFVPMPAQAAPPEQMETVLHPAENEIATPDEYDVQESGQ